MKVYGKNNFRKVRIYVDYDPVGWSAMSPDIDYVLGTGESFHIALVDFLDNVNVRWGDACESEQVTYVDMRTPLIRTDILPQHLSKFRRACGLTKKEIAVIAGLSPSKITKIEEDIRLIPFQDANSYLNALAKAANLAVVSVDFGQC